MLDLFEYLQQKKHQEKHFKFHHYKCDIDAVDCLRNTDFISLTFLSNWLDREQ